VLTTVSLGENVNYRYRAITFQIGKWPVSRADHSKLIIMCCTC